MNNYFALFLLFNLFLNFSCTTIEIEKSDGIIEDYRNKSFIDKKYAGSTCADDCIWSTYAVNTGIQQSTATCETGGCVCVKDGDIYTLCEEKNNFSNEESTQDNITYNTQERSYENIPYYNQYDNINYGYATCQNTSIAMVLSHLEFQIHPDSIFNSWGKDIAQSPSGLNRVYKSYANNSDIRTFTNASPEDLRSALQQGFIVIAHGYFTRPGHVIVIKYFDGQRYYVNDPAGQWDGCFKCGYHGSYNGITSYSKDSLESAVFTSDGYTYLPGWIHVIK